MKTNILNHLNIEFDNDIPNFSFCALVDRDRFKQDDLSNLDIEGKEFYSLYLLYSPNNSNKQWITDNEEWIFKIFYKLLKKDKFNKLRNECFLISNEYDESYIETFMEFLKYYKKDILDLLKNIKKQYNLYFE